MLREIRHVRQIAGEPARRWFTSHDLDLIVWENAGGQLSSFQLCYSKGVRSHALTWHANGGFTHRVIDDGETGGPCYKATPILLDGVAAPTDEVLDRFMGQAGELPYDIVLTVNEKISRHIRRASTLQENG